MNIKLIGLLVLAGSHGFWMVWHFIYAFILKYVECVIRNIFTMHEYKAFAYITIFIEITRQLMLLVSLVYRNVTLL